jgi:triacylglycerol lipase
MFPRLRAPLVLIHGMFGFDQLSIGPLARWEYFRHLPQRLRDAGNRVLVPRLSPTGGIVQRANQLQAFLDAHVPDGPLHLVGHSMGGLDARYLIARLPAGHRVLSLTTLGTPHRGSTFADWSARRLVRLVSPLLNRLGIPTQGFLDLTTRAMKAFNANVLDRPGVRYFSVGGEWGWNWHNPSWHMSFPVVSRLEGPNDGLVSVSSAQWGESFEVWPGDHMTLANWPEPFVSSQQSDRLPRYAALLSRLQEI